MTEEKRKFIRSLIIPTLFVILIILVELTETFLDENFVAFGIYPRAFSGLVGIISAPLIHSDLNHLFSNIFPLLVLGVSLEYFYPESSKKVFAASYFITAFLVWMFARSSFHIGASGIVYSLVAFFFFSGVIKKDKRSITLSLLVVFLYGGLAVGIFPIKEGVSWESHLLGGIVGFITAVIFKKYDTQNKYDWENEEQTPPEEIRKLEISYKKGYQGREE